MRKRNKLLAAVMLLSCGFIRAQAPAEIGLISDNDLYTSFKHDRYYTNGIEFYYRWLADTDNGKVAKLIAEVKAGQYMYNPQSVKAENINVHDRPFAGYLFGEVGANTFYKSESVLKLNFQVGIVGKESLAEDLQKGLHHIFHYPKVRGWQYQIPTTVGVQIGAFYSKKILAKQFHEKVDLHLQAKGQAGTIFTGITFGPMMRISFKRPLKPVYESILHGATLSHDKKQGDESREFFFFINPKLNYQVYDATIEGSLFNDDSPVTFPLIPWRFVAETGVMYRKNNWNLSFSFNYQGKELTNNVIQGYYYGRIGIGYLL
ncbi:lipid A deacylase LpxR family protein [Flavobacterium beibuense]|uniref:lipid A deacylase LpxR family protein n=1 Tax=Flavobacterium beibuense TaxID=657326 RepID=UPI003A91BA48